MGRSRSFWSLRGGVPPRIDGQGEYIYLRGDNGPCQEGYKREMLKFAELKRFENMKLMNFSSGMYVQFAFSTAIQTDPDVLLVDEVLAVGDEAFQRKCGEKIEEIRRSGKAILLVLHAIGTVRGLCERCMLLDGGRVVSMGETDRVLAEYVRMMGDETSSC